MDVEGSGFLSKGNMSGLGVIPQGSEEIRNPYLGESDPCVAETLAIVFLLHFILFVI